MNTLRQVSRRIVQRQRFALQSRASTGGGILNDEERAAENIFIKKQEAEKAEFLRKLREGKTAEAAEAAAKAAGHAAEATASKASEAGGKVAEAAGGTSTFALAGATLAGVGLGYFLFGK